MQTPSVHIYEFGEFQLDTGKRLLRRLDGTPVPLTPRVFETLLYMVEHHEAVLDKERIMEAVWPDSIVEENNLAQAISKLRQVLGETPGSHSYIVTVPGRGYRFVAEVNKRNGDIVSIGPADSTTTPTSGQELTEADSTADRDQLLRKARRGTNPSNWRIFGAAIAAIIVVGLAALFFVRYRSLPASVRAPSSPAQADAVLSAPARIAEKSIAVLPFDNLSEEKQNAYFAVGVQDEIMSDLARIADLKVISRTSANLYKSGNGRNSREIGQQLGVAHLLEGNVQRIGNRLRVNAQLIDARTDTHLWAQTYDRDVTDLLAVQSEIAQAIAGQLHATISPAEKLAIERPPTNDLTAFDLYTRANNLLLAATNASNTNTGKDDLLKTADLLNQAVARDPTFFQAYCQLAWTHDYLYFNGFDRTPARLALAEAAIQAASRLRPDAGEAHLARAWNLYWGYRDYDAALAELDIAGKVLPNNPRLFELKGYIERRRPSGDQARALRSLERAIELDPRNIFLLQRTSECYEFLRRYREQESLLVRALDVDPNNHETKLSRAWVVFDWKADTRPLHKLLDEFRANDPAAIQSMADSWLLCALAERDVADAADALAALGENNIGNETLKFTPRFVEGLIARMTKDDSKARSAFSAARAEQEKLVRGNPDDAGALSVFALIDAALGHKDEALRTGRRAVEMLPIEKDAISGRRLVEYLAVIAAWVGETELACEQLDTAIHLPCPVTYGELKLLPFWDPLRGDPRFEQIVASLAPKGN
jgi:TolB-like protein/DNA-binding winged helix-turn-helix (wHTH) protein/Tfp pilus assembly protein PilF